MYICISITREQLDDMLKVIDKVGDKLNMKYSSLDRMVPTTINGLVEEIKHLTSYDIMDPSEKIIVKTMLGAVSFGTISTIAYMVL